MRGPHRSLNEARAVRAALTDPWRLCRALGLVGGYKPQRQGRGLLIRCPAHGDRGPSCSVRVGDDGTIAVRCHGCGWSGDALSLIAIVHGLDLRKDFPGVLRQASAIAGVYLPDDRTRTPATRTSPTPLSPHSTEAPKPTLGDDAFDRLASDLLERCPIEGDEAGDAAGYLADRGLLEQARRARWGVLPPPARQGALLVGLAKLHGAEALALAGLVRRDEATGRPALGRFAWARHRVLIPYRAPGVAGGVQTLQRRRIDPGEPRYVGCTGRAPRWPYGVEALGELAGEGTAIAFVEGAFDVLAARALYEQRGLDRVPLGIPGVQHWQPTWARFAAGRAALVALDADRAGEGAVIAIAADLARAGATRVVRVRPSWGKDWAEAMKASGT